MQKLYGILHQRWFLQRVASGKRILSFAVDTDSIAVEENYFSPIQTRIHPILTKPRLKKGNTDETSLFILCIRYRS